MTYELLKQLNDAGFPFRPIELQRVYIETIPVPTLSELVEECVKLSPQGDFHLENLHDDWGAGTCFNPEKADEWYHGSTPEEAVAKLWLELKSGSNLIYGKPGDNGPHGENRKMV